MFIKKSSISKVEMNRILKAAGQNEEVIIKNARWVFLSKNKGYYIFVMPNPHFGKGLDYTKSFSCMYDRKLSTFIN